MYIDTFDTTIYGVPCIIGVIECTEGFEARTWGHPDEAEPGEPPSITFDVLKLNKRPYPWLADQVDEFVLPRIEAEIKARLYDL